MRILVKCLDCHRRFDASNRKIGSRFRCHCGQVLTVHQPRSHEATVVRCSSCGGPRQQQAEACVFCGADFSTHERDLFTVCPDCLARVSDRAKFCPQCSVALGGEQIVKQDSSFTCPTCGGERKLSHRRLGKEQASVLECDACTGFWISIDSFVQLRDRVMRQSLYAADDQARPSKQVNVQTQAGPFYRTCIHCHKRMSRRQYVRGCGIIIDVCRNHGIWFDANELQQTVQWHATGGRQGSFLDSVRKEQQGTPSAHPPPPAATLGKAGPPKQACTQSPNRSGQRDIVIDLLGGLISELSSLFR